MNEEGVGGLSPDPFSVKVRGEVGHGSGAYRYTYRCWLPEL